MRGGGHGDQRPFLGASGTDASAACWVPPSLMPLVTPSSSSGPSPQFVRSTRRTA
jgi:hypothetical protein